MDGYERYGIYFAPEAGSPLAEFGAAWLGWDPEARADVPRLAVPGLPEPVEKLTEAPRRYGFHGTLKAPFRLSADRTTEEFDEAVAKLAQDLAPFDAPPLAPVAAGFLSLRPTQPCEELDGLAETCLRELDAFRAPPDAKELQRRRAAGLSAAQERNLRDWGYPYALDAFRFHLTLTGAFPAPVLEAALAALSQTLAAFIAGPMPVREICVFGDPGGGAPFHLLRRHRLGKVEASASSL
jgi:putative phosphonate metabolism protein